MLDLFVLPLFRLMRNIVQYRYALFCARFRFGHEEDSPKVIFVIGCGRSGTSILGDVLETNPDVRYLYEPLHLWAAVDPRFDLTNLFTETQASAIVDETFYSANSQLRFNNLFPGPKNKILIEKTPQNAMRIAYLEKLAPNSYFLHIVRCGMEVVESIDKLATNNTSKIFGNSSFNQWWGKDFSKWSALKRDGVSAGFNKDELNRLITHRQQAAFEWILTLSEVEKNSRVIMGRFLEIKYNDFVTQPADILERIVNFLGWKRDGEWLEKASKIIRENMSVDKEYEPLVLPPMICESFNYYQNKYGFLRMAIAE